MYIERTARKVSDSWKVLRENHKSNELLPCTYRHEHFGWTTKLVHYYERYHDNIAANLASALLRTKALISGTSEQKIIENTKSSLQLHRRVNEYRLLSYLLTAECVKHMKALFTFTSHRHHIITVVHCDKCLSMQRSAHGMLSNIETAPKPNTANAILRHGSRSKKLDSEQNLSNSSWQQMTINNGNDHWREAV